MVISFDKIELFEFRRLRPEVQIGMIYTKIPANNSEFENVLGMVEYIFLVFKNATQEIIEKIQKRGVRVFVYTLNKKEEIKQAKKLDVDGIASDYPDVL